ncbi:choice-of-anchor U domain-containing protein [uncultured Abyssibacter sp.]|uniref:choice-of-anchor U domain-containing protein n=1 Tax=uncultured Abyssibacter sp. TaxID=2320202 RepID=UPI0032B1D22D
MSVNLKRLVCAAAVLALAACGDPTEINLEGVSDNQQQLTVPGGGTVTLTTSAGTLSEARVIDNPAPGAAPAGVSFDNGFYDFSVTGLTPGASVDVTIQLPAGSTANTYYKVQDGQFTQFDFNGTDGARFNGRTVTLTLVDGGRGDDDGVANGVIDDPGAPGTKTSGAGVTTPGTINSALVGSYTLTYHEAASGGPFSDGDTVNVTVAADGRLTVPAGTFGSPFYRSFGGTPNTAEIIWLDAGAQIEYALSDNNSGNFNEINIGDASQPQGSGVPAFLGQLRMGTTGGPDTTPDAFAFTDQTGVPLSTVVTSNTVTITGIDSTVNVSVQNGEWSPNCQPSGFTTADGVVEVGQTLCVRHTSASSFDTTVTTTLTVGTVMQAFTSRTQASAASYDITGGISGAGTSGSSGQWELFINGSFANDGPLNDGNVTYTAAPVADGASYQVVASPVSGLTCSVANASGTVSGGDVTGVDITCSQAAGYDISGTIAGLPSTGATGTYEVEVDGTVVAGNAMANGAITYNVSPVPDGSNYIVRAFAPSGYSCTVLNAAGTVSGGDVTGVDINCMTTQVATYSVSGNISGVGTGGSNGQWEAFVEGSLVADGPLTDGAVIYASGVADGASYEVTASPSGGLVCTVANATGTVSGGDITGVDISCSTPSTFSLSGAISGIPGTNSMGQWELLSEGFIVNDGGLRNGAVTYTASIADGSDYEVRAQPSSGLTCTVANGSGTVSGADITDIDISCSQAAKSSVDLFISGMDAGTTLDFRFTLGSQVIEDTYTQSNASIRLIDGTAEEGTSYTFEVLRHPEGKLCLPTPNSASGTMPGFDLILNAPCEDVIGGLAPIANPPSGTILDAEWGNGRFVMAGQFNSLPFVTTDGQTFTGGGSFQGGPTDIAFDGNQFIAVRSAFLSTSTDGSNWTDLPGNQAILNMQYLHGKSGQYVGVGLGGRAFLSSDLSNWTEVATGSTRNLQDVTEHNGTYVAVALDGDIVTSVDGGQTWTLANPIPNTPDLRSVIWDGSQFVVVGQNALAISADGFNWLSLGGINGHIRDITVANGLYVLVGDDAMLIGPSLRDLTGYPLTSDLYTVATGPIGTIALGQSSAGYFGFPQDTAPPKASDGWRMLSPRQTYNNLNRVVWDGQQFIAVGGRGQIFRSTNTELWVAANTPALRDSSSGSLSTFATDGQTFVAAVTRGTTVKSFDGDLWGEVEPTESVTEIFYNGTEFVGINGSTTYVSPDGHSWTTAADNAPYIAALQANQSPTVAYDGTMYYRILNGSTLQTSSDASTWLTVSPQPFVSRGTPKAIAYDGSQLIVVGSLGYVYSSADGTNWTTHGRVGEAVMQLNDIAFNGTDYVTVGHNGQIWASTDLNNWDTRSHHAPFQINDVVVAGSELVAAGAKTILDENGNEQETVPAIAISYDGGFTWQEQTVPLDYTGINNTVPLLDIEWNGSQFVAVGGPINPSTFGETGDGRVIGYVSADGQNWTLENTLNRGTYSGLDEAAGTFLAYPQFGFSSSEIRRDIGTGWTDITGTLPEQVYSGSTGRFHPLEVMHDGSQYLFGGGSGMLYSSADLMNWTELPPGVPSPINAIRLINGRYFVPTTGGLSYSDDLTSWTTVINQITSDARGVGNYVVVTAPDGRLYVSEDNGDSFENATLPGSSTDSPDWEQALEAFGQPVVRSGRIFMDYRP